MVVEAAVEAASEPVVEPEPAFVVQVASVLGVEAVPEPELVESERTSLCSCLESRQYPSRLRCLPWSDDSSPDLVTVH